ncbi:hypothetical protein OQA88_10692 [Cercophora sp. LCS_1]
MAAGDEGAGVKPLPGMLATDVALRGDNEVVLMEIARRNEDGAIDAQSRYHPDVCIFVANLLGTASGEALEAAVTRCSPVTVFVS